MKEDRFMISVHPKNPFSHLCYQGRNPMSDPTEYHIHLIS